MMKKSRSRAGFTLTETLITVAILAIMSAAGAVVTGTVLSTRNDMIEAADAQVLASTVLEALADEIRFGQNVRLEETVDKTTLKLNSLSFGTNTFFDIEEGRVVAKGESLESMTEGFTKLLPDKAYTSLKVTALSFRGENGGVTITLTVEGRGGVLWSDSLTVTPLNGIR